MLAAPAAWDTALRSRLLYARQRRLPSATQNPVATYGALMVRPSSAPPPLPHLHHRATSPLTTGQARRAPVSSSPLAPHYLPTLPPHRTRPHCPCQGRPSRTVCITSRHARLHTARLPRGALPDGGPLRDGSAAADAARFVPVGSLACSRSLQPGSRCGAGRRGGAGGGS